MKKSASFVVDQTPVKDPVQVRVAAVDVDMGHREGRVVDGNAAGALAALKVRKERPKRLGRWTGVVGGEAWGEVENG